MSPFARRALAQQELDATTEQALARRAAAGDREAREQLIGAGLRWVVLHALRRGIAGAEFDDAVQDGTVALIRAVDRFDPARGVRLATFAWPAIDGAMVRRGEPLPIEAGVDEPVADPPGDDLLDGLHEDDAEVLRWRFGLSEDAVPRSRREVAILLDLTEAQVRRREDRALRRLRRQWDPPGVALSGRGC